MDEILKTLAQQVGISPEVARNGMGAVLSFLKDKLPDGLFGQVEQSVPEADGLVNAFEAHKDPASGGGLMGAVAGLAGKVLGGGGGDLMGKLTQAGLSVPQVAAFLPKVLDLLQAHLPPELLEKIKGLIGGAIPAATPSQNA